MEIGELKDVLLLCPYDDVSYIKSIGDELKHYKDVLIFGTGGSSLGAKALIACKSGIDNCKNNFHLFENTDAQSFLNKVGNIDKKNALVIVISKSGNTTETIMLFLTLVELWKDFDFQNNAIAITMQSDNDLVNIANTLKMRIIEHPQYIGGRFSVFSIVGLLPAYIFGVDIDAFLQGARDAIENPVATRDVIQQIKHGIRQHVMFCYSDFLVEFGKWFVQLVSESLGKRPDFGITPITATGTIDQHSMLQLFLGGPSDKFFTVVTQSQQQQTPHIKTTKMAGHNIAHLMLAHQNATIEVLKEKAYVQILEYKKFDEESIGNLMMQCVLQTIAIAEEFNINPFDQPAVEKSKIIVMEKLNSCNM